MPHRSRRNNLAKFDGSKPRSGATLGRVPKRGALKGPKGLGPPTAEIVKPSETVEIDFTVGFREDSRNGKRASFLLSARPVVPYPPGALRDEF